MSKQLLQESETVELKKSLAELLRLVHMVEAWGRGVPLILEKEPGVQFREIAKLFITSFERPSFGESGRQSGGHYPRNYPRKDYRQPQSRTDLDAQAACPTGR